MSVAVDYIEAVHIFPIKSCQEATANGQTITELEAGPTGLMYGQTLDRAWVVANPDNLFVSQRGWDENQARKHREDRLLATVAVDIQADYLRVSNASHGIINIPLGETSGEKSTVRIFGPELPVVAENDEAGEFFASLLGRSVKLWRADASRPRLLPDKYQRPDAVNQSAAADGRPLSLASQASLDYLHDLAELPRDSVPLINFRANVDIAGAEIGPFGEDALRQVRIGNVAAYIVKALTRCPMPNFDQLTGDDSQRLATKILRPRMGWALDDDTSRKAEPLFAQSLNHSYIPGVSQTVKAGDLLTVIESGEPNVKLKSDG